VDALSDREAEVVEWKKESV